jgi:hypothetical protein
MEKSRFGGWVGRYIEAWKSNDPEDIGSLFAEGGLYYTTPFRGPWEGREGIVEGWLGRKDEPGTWTFDYEMVASEGDLGILRGETRYTNTSQAYSNIWFITLDGEDRCTEFIEWWMEHE